jgi:peptidoglycan/xylan/chitin deacetylase (PgdA/CDA1 family)
MNSIKVWYDWPLILGYHSVSQNRQDALAVHVADFEYQMAWLYDRGYRAVTLAQFMSQGFTKKDRIVILTFDDGYADNYTLAFPILKKYGFTGTIFLVSDYVSTDHVFYWDAPKIKAQSNQAWYQLLTWEQVEEMSAYGIEFGSHTCTHPELTKVAAESCREELTRSRANLQARTGHEVVSFCYPRGDLNTEVIRMVEKAGYTCAVVTPPRYGIPLSQYTLRRIGINYANTSLVFRLKTLAFVRRNHERIKRFQGG